MNVVWRAAEIKKLIGEITYYSCVILDDVEYSVDDGVYMWSGKEDSPYIGQIKSIWRDKNDQPQLGIRWYYKPNDVADVIQRKCGTRELFPSDMMDENPAHLVTGKVRVLPYQKFKALTAKEQRDPNVYYFKEYYKAIKLKFCDQDPVRKDQLVKEDFPIELREYWLHFFSQQPDEWTPAKIAKYVNIFVEHEIRESSIHLLDPKFLSEVMKITIGHDILKIIELRDFILKTKKETDLNIIDDSTPPSPAKRRSSLEAKKKSPQGTTKSVAVKKSHEKVKYDKKVKKEVKVESESESSGKSKESNESDEEELTRHRPTTRSNSQRRASQEKLKEIKNKLNQDKQRTGNNNISNESQSLTPSADSPAIKVPTRIVKSVIAKPTSQSSSEPKGKVVEVPPQRPTLQSPSKLKEAPRISTLATGTNTTPQKNHNPPPNKSTNNTNATCGSSTVRSSEDVTVTATASPGKTKTVSPFAMLGNMKEVGYKFSGATRSHVGITPVKASSFSAHRSKDIVDLKLKNKAQSESRLSSYTPMAINKLTPKKNVVLDDDSEDEKVEDVEEITSTSATPRNSPGRYQVYDVEDKKVVVKEVVNVDEAPVELEQHQEYSNIADEYANSETQNYEAEQVQSIPPVQPAGYYHANVGLLTGEAPNYYSRPTYQDYNNYPSREGHAEDQRIQPVLQQMDKNILEQLDNEKYESRNQLLDNYIGKMVPISTVATAEMFQVDEIETSPSPVRQKVLPPQNNSLLARLSSSLRDVPNDPFVNNMYSEHSDPLRYSSESFCSQADASQVTDSQLAAILPTPFLQQRQEEVVAEQVTDELAEQNAQVDQCTGLDQSRDDIRPWQSQREVIEVTSQYIDEELPDEVLSQLYDQYAELSQLPPLQQEPAEEVIEIPSTSTPVHIRNRDISTQPQPQAPVQLQETQPYLSYNSHEKSPHNTKKRKFQEMIQISSSSSLDSDDEFSPIPMPTDSSASNHQVLPSAQSQDNIVHNSSPKKKRRKQIVIDPSSPLSQFSQDPIDNMKELSQRCTPQEFYETCSQMFFPPDNSPINVFSGFDGIGGALVALREVGIKVAKYFVCEIDADCREVVQMNIKKHAIATKTPPVKYTQVGPDWDITSVTKRDIERLPKITLFVAGSPCNDLSVLKRDREGLKGSQSRLFYEFVKILKWYKESHPNETPFFLFENVASMRRQDKDEISNCLGVSPVEIDAAQVSGAHRNRYYWTNIPRTGPLLATNIEKQYAQFYLSQDRIALREKMNCITTRNTVQKFTDKTVEWGLENPRYAPVLGADGKLKPLKVSECERFLGFPTGYTECNANSDTKRKEMLGNSFAIPVISYLLEPLRELTGVVPNKTNVYKQQTLTQIVK